MTVDTRGLEAIRRGLPGAIGRGVDRAAQQIATTARSLVPVDTGALRASIRVEPGRDETSRTVVAGGGGVEYAAFIEYGTSRAPAQPFMTPAAAQVDVAAEVADEVRQLIAGAR